MTEMGFCDLILRYDDRKEEIGRRIRTMRTNKGFKQAAFLRALYMSDTSLKSLRSWEKGEILPDIDTLARMAEVFDCDIGYLLCDYDEIKREISDICDTTGFSSSAAKTIQDLDIVVANKHFVNYENGTLSKRYILSQIIADDRIIQVLIAAKQAKTIKYRMQKDAEPDVTKDDFEQALYALDELNMVALRPDDSVNFYIQDSGRVFMDILRRIVDGVSDDESYSTDIVSVDPNKKIIKWAPDVYFIDD